MESFCPGEVDHQFRLLCIALPEVTMNVLSFFVYSDHKNIQAVNNLARLPGRGWFTRVLFLCSLVSFSLLIGRMPYILNLPSSSISCESTFSGIQHVSIYYPQRISGFSARDDKTSRRTVENCSEQKSGQIHSLAKSDCTGQSWININR